MRLRVACAAGPPKRVAQFRDTHLTGALGVHYDVGPGAPSLDVLPEALPRGRRLRLAVLERSRDILVSAGSHCLLIMRCHWGETPVFNSRFQIVLASDRYLSVPRDLLFNIISMASAWLRPLGPLGTERSKSIGKPGTERSESIGPLGTERSRSIGPPRPCGRTAASRQSGYARTAVGPPGPLDRKMVRAVRGRLP
jgi:hypothetical protein